MAVASRTWIRRRSHLPVAAAWHLEQTSTQAGVRITSCAEVLTPEDDVEYALADLDPEADVCTSCAGRDDGQGTS